MSRGGARGGRGGRGGSATSYSREQLTSLGVSNNEAVPGPVLQPPPLYPMLERKPVSLSFSPEMDYFLILRQDFIDHMQLSASYTNLSNRKSAKIGEQPTIDRLVAQLPSNREKYDWSLFPTELRPKLSAKRALPKRAANQEKNVNITATLDKLESLEVKSANRNKTNVNVKEEKDDDDDKEDEDIEEAEDIDDEMDDGTDYANNYFDNGEGYEDDDDNLDDGPVY